MSIFPFSTTLLISWFCMTGNPADPIPAKQPAEEAVKTCIRQLFEGMRKGDSSMVKEVFAPGAVLQTIRTLPDGTTHAVAAPLQTFLLAIGTPHTDVWDERIEFGAVQVDHELASVWAPYSFYRGGRFSHCGVNSFQLVKLDGRWKIVHLIDNRRKADCIKK